MRNRILLLCLKKHIETVSEYARIMNIEDNYAEDILTQKAPLTNELIEKNCAFFKVSKEYLLCEI